MIPLSELKSRYGNVASWAIWNEEHQRDLSIVEEYRNEWHSCYVLIGLNTSKDIEEGPDWMNFHGGKHDRKLMKACNHSSLRGSYMTDLFKDADTVKGTELKERIENGLVKPAVHVDRFVQEMKDIGITNQTVFVVFGGLAFTFYEKYFRTFFNEIRVIRAVHYSDYSKKDETWVSNFWNQLEID